MNEHISPRSLTSVRFGPILLFATALAACGVEPVTPPSLELDGITVDLGAGARDPSVVKDAHELATDALGHLDAFDPALGHRIEITYLGKAAFTAEQDLTPLDDASVPPPEPDPEQSAMDGVNLATGNEFRIALSYDLLEAIGTLDAARGDDRGTLASEADEPVFVPEGLDPALLGQASLSNADDDRYRPYSRNAPVSIAVHRRIVNMGNCTGTLVGPRHVVTAGHCLYSRRNSAWSNNFSVDIGRNGNSVIASVQVDRNNIPSGQTVWLFTPWQFRSASNTKGYDYGVLTIPARLGDTVGWMGRVTYSAPSLRNGTVYRRGYPLCTSTWRLSDNTSVNRVDEPCSDNGPAGLQSCTCRDDHLYANAGFCDIDEFQTQDSSGWSRVIHHSCDASAADSGSPLYVYYQGSPAVTAVHYQSLCERIPASHNSWVECTGTRVDRPLRALRLTPEWRDWIGYFRNRFP